MNILGVSIKRAKDERLPEGVDYTTFSSSDTFHGYDVVVIDLDQAASEFTRGAEVVDGWYTLSIAQSRAWHRKTDERQQEIFELMLDGKAIIILNHGGLAIKTLRVNKAGNTVTESVTISSVIPFPYNYTVAGGQAIGTPTTPAFQKFVEANAGNLRYNSILTSGFDEHTMFVRGTKKTIGAYSRVENGSVIFLPGPQSHDLPQLSQYFGSVIQLAKALQGEQRVTRITEPPPLWALKGFREFRAFGLPMLPLLRTIIVFEP